MTVLNFTVPGVPVAKGRPRMTTRGGHARAYTPAKTVAYEGLIALAGQEAMAGRPPLEGPIYLVITATFPWLKKHTAKARSTLAWHTSKPDADNIAKAVGDGLNAVAWRDDSQIVQLKMMKLYGDVPGLSVLIQEIAA